MNLDVSGASYWEIPIPFLGNFPLSETLMNTWLVMIIVTGLCIWLTRDLKVRPTSKKQIVAEYIVKTAKGFVEENMGKEWSSFIPFVSALFALSMFSSLTSLVGLYAPTSDLSTLLGWALLVFGIITYTKFKTNGVIGYFKGYTEPIPVLTPFNIISEIATPVSMAFRHFGNIASGSVITALLYAALTLANGALFGLLPGLLGEVLGTIPFLAVGIPAVFSVYFDLFSSGLQAFIFCMLTMMYISSAAQTD